MKATLPPGKYYIGDVCYVLSPDHYYEWDVIHGFTDGLILLRPPTDAFVVAKTPWGDGAYIGSDGVWYGVDAGNIGIVPIHMCQGKTTHMGSVYEFSGNVKFEYNKGVYTISGCGMDGRTRHAIRIDANI